MLGTSVPESRPMFVNNIQWGRIRMPMFSSLYWWPLSTWSGVAMSTTGILVPERRFVSRTPNGQWHKLYLSAQLFRFVFLPDFYCQIKKENSYFKIRPIPVILGSLCENPIQLPSCQSNPCLNDGTCYLSNGEMLCVCRPGFTGARCSENIDDCLPSSCLNGGVCQDGIHNFTCNCLNTG